MLLLAACRDGWRGESNRLSAVAGLVTTLEHRDFPEWLGKLFLELDALHALPVELRTTPSAKADLAKVVFEECQTRTSLEETEAVRWAISVYLAPDVLAPQADLPSGLDGMLRNLRRCTRDSKSLTPRNSSCGVARASISSFSRRTSICRRPTWRGD